MEAKGLGDDLVEKGCDDEEEEEGEVEVEEDACGGGGRTG
jgi:hypothetical protein